jgi:hypothetical protein
MFFIGAILLVVTIFQKDPTHSLRIVVDITVVCLSSSTCSNIHVILVVFLSTNHWKDGRVSSFKWSLS